MDLETSKMFKKVLSLLKSDKKIFTLLQEQINILMDMIKTQGEIITIVRTQTAKVDERLKSLTKLNKN